MISGILNTIGRVSAGAVTQIPGLSVSLVNSVSTLVAGIFVLLTPFCTTYPAMVVTAAGYGFLGCKIFYSNLLVNADYTDFIS